MKANRAIGGFRMRLVLAAPVAGLLCVASAQICDPNPPAGRLGVESIVSASTLWDADGPGPQSPLLVLAGSFVSAGPIDASRVVAYDFVSGLFRPLGVDRNGATHHCIAARDDGWLVTGFGAPFAPGGVPANNVAAWNGIAWEPLGLGVNNTVLDCAFLPNGDLVVVGLFTSAGGQPANRIARWDGSTWSTFGTGLNRQVDSLAVLPNGDIAVGGFFTEACGVSTGGLARWDGSAWTDLGDHQFSWVAGLTITAQGHVVAAGNNRVALWNGSSWATLGTANSSAWEVEVLTNGYILAGGAFTTMNGLPASGLAVWTGNSWQAVGGGVSRPVGFVNVNTFTELPTGYLAVGGYFDAAGGRRADNAALFNGTAWQPLVSTTAPLVQVPPASQTTESGRTTILRATAGRGYAGVSVQWFRNGNPVANGPGGASPAGGTVSGASAPLPSPSNGSPVTLTITNTQPSDAGHYTATFSNSCGSTTSIAATLTITCSADFNHDGGVDSDDVIDFFSAWDAGNIAADFNHDAGVDSDDVIGFFERWDAGC